MDPDTAIKIIIATALTGVGICTYLAISFGPFVAGWKKAREDTIKAITELSLENPKEFGIWLCKQQIKLTKKQTKLLAKRLPTQRSA
jgi:hypothetical protein